MKYDRIDALINRSEKIRIDFALFKLNRLVLIRLILLVCLLNYLYYTLAMLNYFLWYLNKGYWKAKLIG